jgi:uncharacterized protein YjgD (DUF1641 family)
MAEPILLNLRSRDPRQTLYQQLEEAPREHVEALLATYEVLQGLHDRGVLEILRGALGSSERVLQILVNAANQPEIIRGIRNLLILVKVAGGFEPALLERLAQAVSDSLAEAKNPQRQGPWKLLQQLSSPNTGRALITMTSLLESIGRSLATEKKMPENSEHERPVGD